MEEVKTPNFFIIGAPKCGTTSLAAWLGEHPNIYMSPIKEPWFFCRDIYQGIKTWEEYLQLFQNANPKQSRIGEASTSYLFSRVAVPAIEEKFQGASYIVMVRNPVEMAYSLHEQHMRDFREDITDFEKAWRMAPERRAGKRVPRNCPNPVLLDYPSWGKIGEQLERLYSLVRRERVLLLFLDDIKENPRREYLKVMNFLKVIDDSRRDFPTYNPAREWRLKTPVKAAQILRWKAGRLREAIGIKSLGLKWLVLSYDVLNEALNARKRPRMPMSTNLRQELMDFFTQDIRLLEELTDRDLSVWMDGSR
ncbi:MAG: sulfotransferase domain-containing protein [Deltaproteobacteria bacterium]|nr:sulfotransferase domain-containing protein [Deltaproteobacteria bacterium]MBW1979236.1 sulfotransferase domain-containing protein [Deltaproteobacteria bacterium]MBW2301670.1 sulfotransferase domain-containing protein [Deltaproteobacteria bacterium]